MPKGIAILGSTGSIGTQALDVVREHPGHFQVELLTAGRNADLLIAQALEFKPNAVVIADAAQLDRVKDALFPQGIKVYGGLEAIAQAVTMDGIDVVLTAMVGYAGLRPTLAAIGAGKTIALSNKETLVVAGEPITRAAREAGVNIYPVDSEHSAIFQCLVGEWHNPIEKIVLTASGGPFRGRTREELATVTKAQALKHPNWDMGAKISVDSATMMNKGLELIEASHLFPVGLDRLRIVVHPQSIVHSMVEYRDGSTLAQLGPSDMRVPIASALAWPQRMDTPCEPLDLAAIGALTFRETDEQRFPATRLAREAAQAGGAAPTVLNAANEIAVAAFLDGRIAFTRIAAHVEEVLSCYAPDAPATLDEVIAIDAEARTRAKAGLLTESAPLD